MTPDGGEHQLFSDRFTLYSYDCSLDSNGDVCYTRDGTDIKVKRTIDGSDDYFEAFFPNGIVMRYESALDNYTDESGQAERKVRLRLKE